MQSAGRSLPAVRAFPKLYNAHQRIQVSRGLLPDQLDFFRKNPLSERWRSQVSQDVVDFVDQVEQRDANGNPQNELLPQEKIRLFQNPARYFSRPHNIPESTRQQIHFPEFAVTLLRTPHLGPQYAQFKVPLWLGKLDLKSYLKNLYNVDVHHIRSFVVHHKRSRKSPANRYQRGQKIQPRFRKRMTVQLVEPFVWPTELSEKEMNSSDYAKDNFWKANNAGIEAGQRQQAEFVSKPDEPHRRSIAEQARALLAGKEVWKPTWQQLPQDVRVLQGRSRGTSPVASNLLSPSPLR